MSRLCGERGRMVSVAMSIFLLAGLTAGPVRSQTATQPSPAQTIAQKTIAPINLLDINTATPEQLKALPGMGDAYARRIIANRPYTAKNQLTTRGILPQPAYGRIKDRIIAHRPKP